MAKTKRMVQATLIRSVPTGSMQLTTWIEKRETVQVGARLTLEDVCDENGLEHVWAVHALGSERDFADVESQRDAQRELADKLKGH